MRRRQVSCSSTSISTNEISDLQRECRDVTKLHASVTAELASVGFHLAGVEDALQTVSVAKCRRYKETMCQRVARTCRFKGQAQAKKSGRKEASSNKSKFKDASTHMCVVQGHEEAANENGTSVICCDELGLTTPTDDRHASSSRIEDIIDSVLQRLRGGAESIDDSVAGKTKQQQTSALRDEASQKRLHAAVETRLDRNSNDPEFESSCTKKQRADYHVSAVAITVDNRTRNVGGEKPPCA